MRVKLSDQREFKAKLVGADKQADIAVLRIEASNLPTVKIGNPDLARVGDWVVAIGSPFGFESSVTAGIISAKSRALPEAGYMPFMQTDVPTNPGNSGGPLFNSHGEVIGINSQIYSHSGGYQGLSFAIPINVAMGIEQELLAKGTVRRGRLGLAIQEVNQGLADSFGLDRPRGALVNSVDSDGPAAKSGIQSGDIILKFNGKEIVRSSELGILVGGAAPGSVARLDLWRHGETEAVSVAVEEAKNSGSKRHDESANERTLDKLGLALRPLTVKERRQGKAGLGLVVEDVRGGSAARAGIEVGDIILSANGERVTSTAQLRS